MTEQGAMFPLAGRKEIGYNQEDVDELVTRARSTYENPGVDTLPSGEPAVSAAEIRRAGLRVSRRGYSARHVDAALDRLEEVFYERERRRYLREHGGEAWRYEITELTREVVARAGRAPGKRFRRRGIFATGYRRSQVDAFVDRIASGLAGKTDLTPTQLRESVFHSSWRGYDEAQVDAYLDAVIEIMLSER